VTRGDPIRVVLAEDEREFREALADLIDGAPGLELVAAVADGRQAIEVAGALQPDVAVIDVRMPEVGGVDAARGIKESSPGTRVLALSAFDDRASVLEMLEAGAVGYLLKGVAAGRIVESIEAAAAGGSALSAEVAGGVHGEKFSAASENWVAGSKKADSSLRSE